MYSSPFDLADRLMIRAVIATISLTINRERHRTLRGGVYSLRPD
jgi:hypothetical protein